MWAEWRRAGQRRGRHYGHVAAAPAAHHQRDAPFTGKQDISGAGGQSSASTRTARECATDERCLSQ